MASLEMVSTQIFDSISRNRNRKKKDLKVLVRDPLNNFSELLVENSGSNEEGKSKREVLECCSRSSVSEIKESLAIPFSTNSNSFYNRGQPENPSRNDVNMGASSLVQIWEARSQQSSSTNSSPFSESLNYEAKNNNDDIDWCLQSEARNVLPLVASSPRIRGRQVFADFLIMILRERKKELKRLATCYAVSKFPPRACERLRYMLRTRCFEKCIAIRERYQSKSAKRYSRGSGVMNLRDRYKTSTGKEKTERVEETVEKSNPPTTQEATCRPKIAKIAISSDDTRNKNVLKKPEIEWIVTEKGESSRETEKGTSRVIDVEEIVERNKETRKKEEVSSFEEGKSREIEEYRINPQQVTTVIGFDKRKEEETASDESRKSGREENSSQGDEETSNAEKQEASEMEEEDYSVESEFYDWVNDISQPRSYWDELRNQREAEVMMNKDPKKDDMRNMIKKRTVSTKLASDFREKINKILISRAQEWLQVEINPEDSEEWNVECSTMYQENLEEAETEKIDLETVTDSDGFSQSSGKSTMVTRRFEDHEAAIASLSVSSNLKDHENTSFYETDMICDLREQIKQLQREMLELKSLVKSCVDFHKSAKIESFSGLKCGHELQLSSKKCPICI